MTDATGPEAGIDPESINFLVNELARLFRCEFERRIAQENLSVTPAEARVLAHIARDGAPRQTVLAERLGVAAMSLTGFLDRLEAAGLVERVPDPVDRRAKRPQLTPAARPVLARVARIGAEVRAVAREGISDAEWKAMRDAIRRARDNLARARETDRTEQGAA